MKNQPFKKKFDKKILSLKNGVSFQKFIEVREKVFSMLGMGTRLKPSKYWEEELCGFEYLFDASPLVISQLRKHCYHLTGIRDYDYREHHSFRAKHFEGKLNYLKAKDKHKLFIPESPKLGGFGYRISGQLVNIDTLKFYEALITLSDCGILQYYKNKEIVLEIGAGWGGFAYQFKTLFPKTSYVIVDLPAAILISATYLMTMFPKSRIFISDGDYKKLEKIKIDDWDFIFIPDYLWGNLKFINPSLVINMVSFQEMTESQVEEYIKKSARWGWKTIYSLNRERSYYNKQISSVSEIISKYYLIKDVSISELGYNQLSVNPEKKPWVKILGKILDLMIKNRKLSRDNRYRHLIASL